LIGSSFESLATLFHEMKTSNKLAVIENFRKRKGFEEWKQEQKRSRQDGRQERKRNKTAPRFEKEREAEAI
jgi:hypothetical protein